MEQHLAEQWRVLLINVNLILEYMKDNKKQTMQLKKEIKALKKSIKGTK